MRGAQSIGWADSNRMPPPSRSIFAALQRELDLEPIAAANTPSSCTPLPPTRLRSKPGRPCSAGPESISGRSTSSPAAVLEQVRRLGADFGIAWDMRTTGCNFITAPDGGPA